MSGIPSDTGERLPWPMDGGLWNTPCLVRLIRRLPRLPLSVVNGEFIEAPLYLWVQVRHSGSGVCVFHSVYDHTIADTDWLGGRLYALGLVPLGTFPAFWTVPRSPARAPRPLHSWDDYLVQVWNDEAEENDDIDDTTLVLSVVFSRIRESPTPSEVITPPTPDP